MIVAASIGGGDAHYAWGGVEDSVTTVGTFQRAAALSVDPDGTAYVVDAGSNVLAKFTLHGERTGIVGGYGWGDLTFDQPADVALSSGLDLYVADYGNHRVQRFDRNLNFVATLPGRTEGSSDVAFGYPSGIAISRAGILFIADGENARVAVVNPIQGAPWYFGGNEARAGKLAQPRRIRIGTDDVVHVQDRNSIKEYDAFGNYIRTVGEGVLHHLLSFSLDDSLIFAFEARTVYVFDRSGSLHDTVLIAQFAGGDPGEVVDLAFIGKRALLLFERRLVSVPAQAIKPTSE
jgi:DNA-binding beta-propeller fold protein YncE